MFPPTSVATSTQFGGPLSLHELERYCNRARLPTKLRTSLASTNMIESAFSIVETVCRNVKRWYGGDQYLRWVASTLH
jgi:hypothetical protein